MDYSSRSVLTKKVTNLLSVQKLRDDCTRCIFFVKCGQKSFESNSNSMNDM
jgi:hypothetical protein